MTDEEYPTVRCRFDAAVELEETLESAGIEYLDVDDSRMFVVFQHAVLNVVVTEGDLSAVRSLTVELWEPPEDRSERGPTEILAWFLDELEAASSASRV